MTTPALTLINAFEVPPAADEQFVAAWSRARALLSPQPGYGGAALHRALTPDARFRFINVGRWQTLEAFQSATVAAGIRADAFPFPAHPGLYELVSAEERVTNGNGNGSVTLINLFQVDPVSDDDFITRWESARQFLSRKPGYLDTRLHRAIQPDVDFRFVNIAHWTSPDAFVAALSDPVFRAAAPVPYPAAPALYRPVAD